MINQELLRETTEKLLAPGKGILAADESNGTADKRLEAVGSDIGEEMRKKYRDLFLCVENLEDYVSGVIMFDETFWQKNIKGVLFTQELKNKGILSGIKVDTGSNLSEDFPGEEITGELEGLAEKAKKYFDHGARFTKWRSVIRIDEESGLPTDSAILENSQRMSRYAEIVQKEGLVPIVEPEVLLHGKHNLETAEIITSKVIKTLFSELSKVEVYLPGLILKTSMVISGDENPDETSAEEVADATTRMLKAAVPPETGGVVFLSGGQTAVEASAHLNAIAQKEPLPWEIAFSFARALQGPALQIWKGKEENVSAARDEFMKRLKLNHLADKAEYDIDLEFAF